MGMQKTVFVYFVGNNGLVYQDIYIKYTREVCGFKWFHRDFIKKCVEILFHFRNATTGEEGGPILRPIGGRRGPCGDCR